MNSGFIELHFTAINLLFFSYWLLANSFKPTCAVVYNYENPTMIMIFIIYIRKFFTCVHFLLKYCFLHS